MLIPFSIKLSNCIILFSNRAFCQCFLWSSLVANLGSKVKAFNSSIISLALEFAFSLSVSVFIGLLTLPSLFLASARAISRLNFFSFRFSFTFSLVFLSAASCVLYTSSSSKVSIFLILFKISLSFSGEIIAATDSPAFFSALIAFFLTEVFSSALLFLLASASFFFLASDSSTSFLPSASNKAGCLTYVSYASAADLRLSLAISSPNLRALILDSTSPELSKFLTASTISASDIFLVRISSLILRPLDSDNSCNLFLASLSASFILDSRSFDSLDTSNGESLTDFLKSLSCFSNCATMS